LLEPCNTEFNHEMSVQRIFESPRVTKPYSELQWEQIAALGHAVDRELKEGDVRLTMGGEPTFVSIDDADGAEWTTSAFGPNKRRLSFDLLLKLRDRFSYGALLHFGQGKWYPGEPLPRWSLACYWRKDGVPMWEHPSLIIDDNKTYRQNASDARRFLEALAKRLEVDDSFIMTALEDVFYYMWKERKLPPNVDPSDSKLADPLERATMARVFEEGLGRTVGYVLPIRKVPTTSGTFKWT